MTHPVDEIRTCLECGIEFVFSASERAFFEARDFTPPKRCKPCRQLKAERMASRTIRAFDR
jgi:hypothetical protein